MGFRTGVVAIGWTMMWMMAMPGDMQGQREGISPPAGKAAPPSTSAAPWELPPMAMTRMTGPIELDGVPNEAAWQDLPVLETVQHWPNFGAPPSRRTEIRIGYDDDFLYAAGWFYDEPGGVRGNSLRRDSWDGDDVFDLVVDGFNDDQTALSFTTTPLGVLVDQEILNDGNFAGTNPINRDWNTFWDAATEITEEGWFAEVRVPLASLGFNPRDGSAVMGIIVGRYIASIDEKHVYPAIPPDWDLADLKPSRARDMRIEGVTAQRPLWVTPYALTGVERVRAPDAEVVSSPTAAMPTELGLDVKYGLSSNLTLDLTVNTDFAQVEADALQVNLDRFGLFFPEKRQFFQERSSVFAFDVGEGRLFHSRRIGLSEAGDPVRILGGARLSGRLGGWDVGLLSMQVDGTPGQTGENDAVARLVRTFSSGALVGGMMTSRISNDGGIDLSMGLDGRAVFGSDFVTVQLAATRNARDGGLPALAGNDGSSDPGPDALDTVTGAAVERLPLGERMMARLFWERRKLDGFAYDVDALYSGGGYDPVLGFEARNDFSSVKARARYSWQPEEGGRINRWNVIATTRAFFRNQDGVLESGLFRLRSWANLRGGHWANLALNFTREDVAQGFDLPGATVSAGRYDGWDLFGHVGLSQALPVGAEFTFQGGTAFDGWRTMLRAGPWWRLNRHLTVAGAYSFNRLHFPSRGEQVNADQVELRISAALDTRLSAEALVQYAAAARIVSTNLRIRYRFSEGRDLFLVFTEGRDMEDRFGLHSALLGRTDRRLLIKYSWAFRP